MTLFTRSTLMALSLIASPFTYAASWQMIGGEYTDTLTTYTYNEGLTTITTNYGQPTQLYAGAPFMDGVSTSTRVVQKGYGYVDVGGDWVLRNSSDPATSTLLFYLNAMTTGEFVDLTPGKERIKVGGMGYYGSRAATNDGSSMFGGWLYDIAIGYSLTPVVDIYMGGRFGGVYYAYSDYADWVPLTVNGDGTYTATWKAVDPSGQLPQNEGELLPRMSITFQAAAVPEPAQTVLFALGLLGVAARVRSLRSSANPV